MHDAGSFAKFRVYARHFRVDTIHTSSEQLLEMLNQKETGDG
jgi:hypothetical protein